MASKRGQKKCLPKAGPDPAIHGDGIPNGVRAIACLCRRRGSRM